MLKQELNRNWQLHCLGNGHTLHAEVPGTVYTDLLREKEMEDPFFRDNEDAALRRMEEDYEYRCRFNVEELCGQKRDELLQRCDRLLLRFEGIDTLGEILLNGVMLGRTDNMHCYWEFDVTDCLGEENELRVRLYSPTRFLEAAHEKNTAMGSEDAMPGFVYLRKAHCMFGWDWGAHLPDAGIFRPVFLIAEEKARIDSVEILQEHQEDRVVLSVNVEMDYQGTDEISYEVTVTRPDGTRFCCPDSPGNIVVENPMLWWPAGYGEQHLYGITVILKCGEKQLDIWERRIGLRTVTMHREKDEWGESFAHEVNGIRIFAMGADYIPEDHLLGRVSRKTTEALLKKARFANFNTIRVWGGGYYPDDWFFDLCDEMGLLVWQDFMFACAMYDLTPEFEKSITREVIQNLKRLRHHASLALFCGNNEMEMFAANGQWVSKPSEIRDYFIMYERIFPALVKEYAAQTYYWPASPSSGGSFDEPNDENRGDVHYWDVWHGSKPFTEYRKFYFRYASEFGFQSFPFEKTIDTITDRVEDKNIFSYIMERHQRNGSGNGKIMFYLQQMYLYPTSFSAVLYASQLLQADAVRYGVEHFRRNRGRCMGSIYWQMNDCWPVASWSSIDYCGRLKALHYAARRFFAPLMLSCEEQGMLSSGKQLNQLPGDYEKSIRLNAANETRERHEVLVKWQLRNAGAEILKEEEKPLSLPPLSAVWLEKAYLPDIDVFTEYVSYELWEEGCLVSEGSVNFCYPKYFRFQDPELQVRTEGSTVIVSAKAFAKSVEILNEEEDLILSDNYFDLHGGEKRLEILSGRPEGLRVRSVYHIR